MGDLVLGHSFVDRTFANKRRDDALRQVVRANIVHDGLVKIDDALGKRKTNEVRRSSFRQWLPRTDRRCLARTGSRPSILGRAVAWR